MTLNISAMGPPKINKKAAKNKKRNWRKNIDTADIEEALEEQRFEERVGGSFAARDSKDLFTLDTEGKDPNERKVKKNRREQKPNKAWALLNGLGGAPDPIVKRNRVRTKEEKESSLMKKRRELRIQQGIISNKERNAQRNRKLNEEKKKAREADNKNRRRIKFDFDLWAEDTKGWEGVDKSWIGKELKVHTDIWTTNLKPKEAEKRSDLKNKTLIDTVEVPHPGQSYNPTLQDHQDILWKAAMVEIDKDKAQKKIERSTTGMYPKAHEAPTQQTYYKEMSEGIAELQGKDEKNEDTSDEETPPPVEEEKEKVDGATPFKTKTRKQRRDALKRVRDAKSLLNKKKEMAKENTVFNLKSFKKEISQEEEKDKKKQQKKAEIAIEKLKKPAKLSKYKYEPEEIPIKLSDELSGNLRCLKAEGSVLDDRFKSMQRRNMIETRVRHYLKKSSKLKLSDKRSHKMGFEEKLRATQNARMQKKRHRQSKWNKNRAKKSAQKSAVLQTTF